MAKINKQNILFNERIETFWKRFESYYIQIQCPGCKRNITDMDLENDFIFNKYYDNIVKCKHCKLEFNLKIKEAQDERQ